MEFEREEEMDRIGLHRSPCRSVCLPLRSRGTSLAEEIPFSTAPDRGAMTEINEFCPVTICRTILCPAGVETRDLKEI